MDRKRSPGSLFGATALTCAVAFLSLTIPCFAQQSLPTRHVHQVVSSGKAPLIGPVSSTQIIQLAIMLPLRNQSTLTALLQQIHDPSSPEYRHFLSAYQFTEQFGPTADDYQKVVQFAQANGFTVIDTPSNRLVVFVSAPVSAIEQAFHVNMNFYQHPTENRMFFSPDREPIINLDVPLWHIAGLNNYSIPHPLYLKGSTVQGDTTGSGPSGSFLGSDRRAAYYGGTTLNGAGQAVGLFELDGYAIGDVNQYFTNVNQPHSVPVNNVLLLGASGNPGPDDTEQVIDIIDAESMAPGLSQIRVYIAPSSTFAAGTSDVAIFNKMASEDIAKQISVSWGWKPADPRSDTQIFQEMEGQGQNVFVASGDSGAWVSGDFVYPAEDPNVTAVGGTLLTTNGAGGSWSSEIAWGGSNTTCTISPSGSGGGISLDNIQIPPYQQIQGVINSSNHGSTTYRNAPDVAAEANCDNYYCANGACGTVLGGTSLAAPTWAGYMALVNQQAVANGIGGLEFLNQLIYPIGVSSSYGTDFHDITVGDNYTTASPNLYPAVAGYDLVTGWGSPNGANLITSSCWAASSSDSGAVQHKHLYRVGRATRSHDLLHPNSL
jgi:subtilase family serine protease